MKSKKRHISPVIILLLGSLAVFVAAHISYLTESNIASIIHLYIFKVWNMIFPVLAVIFTLSGYRTGRTHTLFLSPLVFSLTKLAYYLLYYYEYYVLEEHLVSVDALLMSAIRSLLVLVFSYLHILAYSLILLPLIKLFSRKDCATSSDRISLFDLSHPTVTISVGAASLGLLYTIALEIYDTIDFLKSSLSSMNSAELLTIICNYLLILAVHVAIYYLSVKYSLPNYCSLDQNNDDNC